MINRTNDEIKTCLKYYIPIKYWVLNDWDMIIKRCVEVSEGVFLFKCSFYDLYFDKDMNPVNYDKMIVCDDKNKWVYYDFDKGMKNQFEPPIPLGAYDWEHQHGWGD